MCLSAAWAGMGIPSGPVTLRGLRSCMLTRMPSVQHRSSPKADSVDLSDARIAAEAMFEKRSTPRELVGGPVVVVKRKRAIAASDDDDDEAGDDSRQAENARLPRVYRIEHESSPTVPELSVSPAGEQAFDAPGSGHGDATPSTGAHQSSRRRRTKKHGTVTVIRPAEFGESNESNETLSAASVPESAADQFAFDIVALRQRTLAGLKSISAELQSLERKAEAVRKSEAASAVRWIRKAIAKYGFKSSDLGL